MFLDFLKTYKLPLLFAVVCCFIYGVFAYNLERSDFVSLITLYSALFLFSWFLIKRMGHQFWVLTGIGIVFRLIAFLAIPNLSQDFYRFLWDGRLLAQGVNPYLVAPQLFFTDLNTALEITKGVTVSQAQQLYEGMGSLNASHYSNYPPINQLCFVIAAFFAGKSITGSVLVLRTLIILADIGILYFGKKILKNNKLLQQSIFWFFINPFIIIELTGNLHFEGVMLFFFIWALYMLQQKKWFWAAVLIGLSISVKLIPLLLLPLFFKWFYKREASLYGNLISLLKFYSVAIGTVIVTFIPFLSSAFIQNFTATISLWFQNFEFNASVYYIIRWIGYQTVGWNIIATAGKILPIVILLFIFGIGFFRKNKNFQQLSTGLLFAISFYFLLATTVHPWYVATPLVLCLFTKYRFPIVWSATVMLSYAAYCSSGFDENLWLVALEYTLVIAYAIYEIATINTRKNNPQTLG